MAPQAKSLRLKILCRTPVSNSQYLSYESKSNLKTPNIASRPECQLELPGDGGGGGGGGGDGDVPRTLPIRQEP